MTTPGKGKEGCPGGKKPYAGTVTRRRRIRGGEKALLA